MRHSFPKRVVWLAMLTIHLCGTDFVCGQVSFQDISRTSGLDFLHRDGSSGKHYLVEVVAAGLASFDYDLDGRIDVYFLNGAPMPGTQYAEQPTNQLYRNIGDFKFENASDPSGLTDSEFGLGVSIGDYDSDGFPDVYLSNHGPNTLYHNNGDGTFTAVRGQTSLECGDKVGGGVCMLDIEGDGDLDIYASSYMQFDFSIPPSTFRGRIVYGGPLLYPKAPDNLLRNEGDGTFTDISEEAGIAAEVEWGMGTICFDFDDDGDTDIFVADDSTQNLLWTNDGNGKFENTAILCGIAYDRLGDPQGSMGIDVADFDGDLNLDLFQTAYTKQLATLYQNQAGLFFEDATLQTGAGVGSLYPVNWGTGFGDFDNDGDKDLFIANGHIHDNMDDLDDTVSYRLPNQVLLNVDNRKFLDVSSQAGSGLLPIESSRGSLLDDFDNDGRLDVVVLNSRVQPSVLKNESAAGNWVELQLVGRNCNRDAVGSQATIFARGRPQKLEVHSGRGYQSHFGSRLHFGLGSATTVERLQVRWHGGNVQDLTQLPANRIYVVREGQEAVPLEVVNR